MKSEFFDLGFHKYFFTKEIRSIAGQFSQNNRCGIYILHFENNEYYVGLAIDVVKRYAQHRQNHKDITYISFKDVLPENLRNVEVETVHHLEKLNKPLRNLNIVSIVLGDTDLDLILSKEKQDVWVTQELTDEQLETQRFDYPELRKKYSKKFQKLLKHSLAEEILGLTRAYTLTTIPYPKLTEYSFWSISCLPGTVKENLVRVNIFWQETLVISQYKIEEEKPYSFDNIGLEILIWVSKSVLEKFTSEDKLMKEFQTLRFIDWKHNSGGQDQQCIWLEGIEFNKFLFSEGIIEAARTFNLRLMRKGGCIWNRYHCFDLADKALKTDDLKEQM